MPARIASACSRLALSSSVPSMSHSSSGTSELELSHTGGAVPVHREVREPRAKARVGLERVAHGVKDRRIHRLDAATALAHLVLAIGPVRQRIQPRAVTDVDVRDDAEALEALEVAVHRRPLQALARSV